MSSDLWSQVPGILERIRLPAIPARESVAALPTSDLTDARAALQSAIDGCAQGGGGRLIVRGAHLIDGPILLRSKVELHLAADAALRFGRRPESYLPPVFLRWSGTECHSYSPLIY